MADYTNPKAQNAILSDLQEIVTLTQTNAKMDPSAQDNIPNGAKRLVAVTGGYQLQSYNGETWTTIDRLVHDTDKLDGYDANTGTAANTIPVRNASGVLPGDLTGNAGTATKLNTARTIDLGGILSAEATAFDGSANITIPVNTITVNNENDDAVNGALSIAHGGTGRTDGAAADVVVSSASGEVKAGEYGQVGDARVLGADEDLNSLVVSGNYISSAGTADLHYPYATSDQMLLKVERGGANIKQVLFDSSGIWTRTSSDTGASWSGWVSAGAPASTALNIYVSKSGSDTNTGLDSAYPVLTINRALAIANGYISSGTAKTGVGLYVGEGEWGDVTIWNNLTVPLFIYAYDGAATEYTSTLPVFNSMRVYGGHVRLFGVVAKSLIVDYNCYLSLKRYNRFAYIRADTAAVWISNKVDIISKDSHDCVFIACDNGFILFDNGLTATVVESLTLTHAFLYLFGGTQLALMWARMSLTVADGKTVTGRKYNLNSGISLSTKAELDKLPGDTAGTISVGTRIGTGIWGGGGATYLAGDGTWKTTASITDPVYKKLDTGDYELAAQLQQVRAAVVTSSARVAAAETSIAANTSSINFIEEFRKSWIGVPRFYHGKTLPNNCMWALRNSFRLGDYPEFMALWVAGGWNGMVAEYSSSNATATAHIGKWLYKCASGQTTGNHVDTTIYLPDLRFMFIRNSGVWGSMGETNYAGVPNITGGGDNTTICAYVWAKTATYNNNCWRGALGLTSASNDEYTYATNWATNTEGRRPYALNFNASKSNSIYGANSTVMPYSVNYPVIIYLGKHA